MFGQVGEAGRLRIFVTFTRSDSQVYIGRVCLQGEDNHPQAIGEYPARGFMRSDANYAVGFSP